MTIIRSLLASTDKRDLSFQSVFGRGDGWPTSKTSAGVRVSEESSLQLVTVYACVALVSEVVGSLPWDVIRVRGGVREEITKPTFLEQPNPVQWDVDFKQRVVTSLMLWGNSFNLVVRDDRGFPMEVWPLHPADVEVSEPSVGRPSFTVNGEPLARHEMLHVPAFGVPGRTTGMSPISAARQAVGLGLAAEEFGARFFGQGANPGGVIEWPGTLSPDEAKMLAQQWQDTYGGVSKSNLPAVITGGANWKPISVPPNDAQFLETRQFQRSEICGLYRVPPHLIGDVEKSTSWGTGIEQQSIGFVTYTLGPWIARLERAFSSLLPRGQQVKFNVNGLLRGDAQARSEFYSKMRNLGAMNADEIRAKEDMPPIEDGAGAIYLQPLNMAPLGTDNADKDSNGVADNLEPDDVVDAVRHSDELVAAYAEIERLKRTRRMEVVRDADGFAVEVVERAG